MAEETEDGNKENEILNAFNAGIDGDKSEDDVKMEMIQAGATFKNVTRLYNEFMVKSGRAMTKEAKAELVDATAKDQDLSTEEGFDKVAKAVAKKGKGINDQSAAALVRAWAKKNEVECYAKPKGTGAARNPFVQNFHAALIENPHMEEQGLKDVIAALSEKDQVNPTRWFNQHNAIRKMVNTIAENENIPKRKSKAA